VDSRIGSIFLIVEIDGPKLAFVAIEHQVNALALVLAQVQPLDTPRREVGVQTKRARFLASRACEYDVSPAPIKIED
jgi:hypothetical protein